MVKTVSVAETIVWCQTINLKTTIFQCSKNYGSSTCVTKLKVAPSMADPISIKISDSCLKSKLPQELKPGTEILVGQVVLSYGSNNQNIVLINNSRTAWPT